MNEPMQDGTFQEYPLAPGMRLLVTKAPKFRRTHVVVFVHDRLHPDRTALGALLPYVQKRGTEAHPTGIDLERAAGELYEAELSGGVHKIGDRQLISYSLDIAADRYAGAPVFSRGLDLLRQMVYFPVREGDGLKADYVEQEKRFQIGRVRALVNQKARYAQHRCIEEMFRGEPFAEHELGTEAAIEAADPKSLLEHHRRLFDTRPVDIYVVGDVRPDEVRERVREAFVRPRRTVEALGPTEVSRGAGTPREVVQEEPMKQGWVVMGLRTDIDRADPDRYGLLFFNGILGGFVHSKLFVNVREKASLAYTASSSYDANKGVILAMAGIDVNKYDQAVDIMKRQIEETIHGEFSDDDLEATRSAFLTRYRMRLDSSEGLIHFHVGGAAEGCPESIDEAIAKVKAVGRDAIARAAERVRLDMIYFLKGVA